jgi:branched-chain amino acid transport system substrate-binding protein
MNAVIVAEAIRAAQQLSGKKLVTGEDVRRGMETLNITDARWKELGFPDFAGAIHLSCADHNGHTGTYLVRWDGTRWKKASDWIQPIKEKVVPLIDGAAEDYAKANAGWPKRTEACDKSS